MERRGRIPVATFRTIDGKPRSRSRIREMNTSQNDPEMDTFTLLEDNFNMKEENENLKLKIAEYAAKIKQLEEDNLQLRFKMKEINKTKPEKSIDLKASPSPFKDSKLQKFNGIPQKCQLDDLQSSMVKKRTTKLKEFLENPSIEFESLLDIKEDTAEMIPLRSVQGLLSTLSQLKTNYSNVELQLYEANEEISVLLEYISQIRGDEHSMVINHQTVLNKTNNTSKEVPVLSKSAKQEDCKIFDTSAEQKPLEELVEKESLRGERIVEVVRSMNFLIIFV